MKTAISLSNGVFREAESHARGTGKSMSQLCADAVSEYLARHSPESVTEAMNKVCDWLGQPGDDMMEAASHRMLRNESWQSTTSNY